MNSTEIVLYNRASTGKIKVIELYLTGANLVTRWGYLPGAMQETSETGKAKNVGKANEVTPEQNAADLFRRKVKKKKDEGYVEEILQLTGKTDPFALPKQFAPAKPKAKITDDALQFLLDSGNCFSTEKRDGQRAFIFIMPDGEVKIMSRRMEDYTEHLPFIVGCMAHVPAGTILDVELVSHGDHDDYDYVGSILRSKPKKALEKQMAGVPLIPYVFDILYHEGHDVTSLPYLERIRIIEEIGHETPMLMATPTWAQTMDELKHRLHVYVARGGEGLVIWDGTAPTVLRYDGKPSRKGGAYKMKPTYEDDFYVRGFEYGNGKNAEVVGALFIFQKNQNGDEIAVGKCGGFAGDSDIRRQLLGEDLKGGSLVVQVEFSKRLKDGLRFPVMQRIRRDKEAKECIYNED
jgi:ATP-dependent DNA ligase